MPLGILGRDDGGSIEFHVIFRTGCGHQGTTQQGELEVGDAEEDDGEGISREIDTGDVQVVDVLIDEIGGLLEGYPIVAHAV